MSTLAFLQQAARAAPTARQDEKAQKMTVTVPAGGDVTEAVVRALLAQLGLRDAGQVAGFNRQAGYDLVRHAVTQLQRQRVFTSQVEAARRQGRRELTVTVAVALGIVNDVRHFLSLPPLAGGGATVANTPRPGAQGNGAGTSSAQTSPSGQPPKAVSSMSNAEKIGEAIRRAIPLLPADVREEVEALLTPQALSIMAGVLVLWVVSHFFGVGEVADVILIVVGVVALGGVAVQAAEELYNFGSTAINAKNEQDLDRAAKHFSEAVSLIGIQAVMAILLKKSPRVLNKTFRNKPFVFEQGINPYRYPAFANKFPAPTTPGKVFYRPKVQGSKLLPEGAGSTSAYGDILYSSRGGADVQKITRVHERVHQLLTPRLQFLREIRVMMKVNGYQRSFLLRYLEEALAETAGQVSVNGFRSAVQGITFPVRNGYVTIAEMRTEAIGVLLGPINVGGMTYRVFYSPNAPSREGWQEVKTPR